MADYIQNGRQPPPTPNPHFSAFDYLSCLFLQDYQPYLLNPQASGLPMFQRNVFPSCLWAKELWPLKMGGTVVFKSAINYLLTPWIRVLFVKLISASQEIPHIVWNLKVHYCFYECPPPVRILSNIDPVHALTSRRSILIILSSHLCLGLPSGLFPSGFPTKTCIHLYCSPYMLHALPSSF